MIYHFQTLFSGSSIGRYYNQCCEIVPSDDDWICLWDSDVLLFNTFCNWNDFLESKIAQYPETKLFTCITNRVNNRQQRYWPIEDANSDILVHRDRSEKIFNDLKDVVTDTRELAGFMMLFQKSTWRQVGGFYQRSIVGVDTDFAAKIIQSGGKISVLQGMYIFHYYRLKEGSARHLFESGGSDTKPDYTDLQIFNIIRQKIKDRQPFSLLRYGDGEGIFAFYQQKYPLAVQNACRKHWGEIPGNLTLEIIGKDIRDSYISCDIPGLPYDYANAIHQQAHDGFVGLEKKLFCNARIHITMYESGFLNEIIRDADIFYLGCRNIREKIMQLGARSFDEIRIAEQARFAKVKPETSFIRQLHDIEKKVMKMRFHGKICLLAAGLAGKYLGIMMRNRGGIVIDIGSVADRWVNIQSRTWIK